MTPEQKDEEIIARQNEIIGNLTTRLSFLQDSYAKRQQWLSEAKRDAGFSQNESFDNVWKVALKAYQSPTPEAVAVAFGKFASNNEWAWAPAEQVWFNDGPGDEHIMPYEKTDFEVFTLFMSSPEYKEMNQTGASYFSWNLDMSTVPKDGTDVMLWHKLWKCPIACRWLKGEWVTCTLNQTWPEEAFTAWMLMKPFTPEYKELFK